MDRNKAYCTSDYLKKNINTDMHDINENSTKTSA